MQQPIWNFEQEPWVDEHPDESSYNLRAYLDRMPDEKMRKYKDEWSEDEVKAWDDNFTSEGNLMLGCSERDIEIDEYRRALRQCIAYRDRVRDQLMTPSNAS